jgi:endonuclease IV
MNTLEGYSKTWKEFEEIIGFEYLKGMHINDSKKDNSRVRQARQKFGVGFIGETV